jgi:hypothetical protein
LHRSILKENNLEEIEFLGLSKLVTLLTIRKEKEILQKFFSSNKITQILLDTNSLSLKNSLHDRCNYFDLEFAQLFVALNNDRLK